MGPARLLLSALVVTAWRGVVGWRVPMMLARPEGSVSKMRLADCWDAHNHLHLSRRDSDLHKLIGSHDIGVSLMGCTPADWPQIRALSAADPLQIRPAYGLHPWWAHEHDAPAADSGWMAELRDALVRDPTACLGEIGLDGQWVPPGLDGVQYEQQLLAFRAQLQLAIDLGRPVSLHCVKAYGDMFDILRCAPELPPAVYMHSWGGKVGMLQSYVKMKKYGDRFYFGFSSFANMRANCHKTAAVIAAVPDDRLLLESDLEDPDDVPQALNTMLHTMAEAKGWTVEQTAAITKRNAQRFATAHGASVRASPSAQPAAALAEIPGDEEWQELRRAIAEQANTVRRMKEANTVQEGAHSEDEVGREIERLKALKSRLL